MSSMSLRAGETANEKTHTLPKKAYKSDKKNTSKIKNVDVRGTHALNSKIQYPNIDVCC